ncbi:MAG: carboxymuconolactone decarboxylase family protein [Armatimonadetes bacterium]|nr:carboxymuconolactone decarboxylase family protein [Armatimonadota bacterium]
MKIRDNAPQAAKGFAQMDQLLMAEGAISAKVKELIALGIAIADHCVPCLRAHVSGCMEEGATREEIIEAAQVAVVMGGGPALIHLPMVIEALDELESRTG